MENKKKGSLTKLQDFPFKYTELNQHRFFYTELNSAQVFDLKSWTANWRITSSALWFAI